MARTKYRGPKCSRCRKWADGRPGSTLVDPPADHPQAASGQVCLICYDEMSNADLITGID